MILLSPAQRLEIQDWFKPESICYNVGPHILQTGYGACFVDRWPDPRILLADVANNCRLYGDPNYLSALNIPADFSAVLYAPESFDAVLRATWPHAQRWDRVYYDLPRAPNLVDAPDSDIRRLTEDDAYHLWGLSRHAAWISSTWGGAASMAASGLVWGAFVEQRLVSVANVFFQGNTYEELGVITEPGFRGLGLSAACTVRLCQEIRKCDRIPGWSTSSDNIGSIRVAEKVGFVYRGAGQLYMLDVPIPAAPPAPDRHSQPN